MAHSPNMVCYAVIFGNKVGIDVEFFDNTIDITPISELAFTREERALFKTFSNNKKYEIFYAIGAQKDSLLKAIGKSFSYPDKTTKAEFTLSNLYHDTTFTWSSHKKNYTVIH